MDFAAYAAVAVAEIPEKQLLPMGSYIFTVTRQPEQKLTATGSYTMLIFSCKVVDAIDDFERPEELAEFEGGVAGESKLFRLLYPETQNDDEDAAGLKKRQDAAVRRISRFLSVDLACEGETMGEMLANSPNCRFVGEIKHKPDSRDVNEMQDEIDRTAPEV
jgi:hypothetical protein